MTMATMISPWAIGRTSEYGNHARWNLGFQPSNLGLTPDFVPGLTAGLPLGICSRISGR